MSRRPRRDRAAYRGGGNGPLARPVLVLGIDGAYVPTRPESAHGGAVRPRPPSGQASVVARPVAGCELSLVSDEWGSDRPCAQLASGAQRGTTRQALKQGKEAGLIPEEQVRLCVVCDGAEWIWKHVQALFPHARQVLDYYHCAQYLHQVAKVHYGASVRTVEWVEATLTRLYLGKVGVVLGACNGCRHSQTKPHKRLPGCWAYLNEHRGARPTTPSRGYPLGSGGIESSNKFICHVRLKRSGAWWYELNSNQMLALRCSKYNGTFDQVFARHQQRLRKA